MVVYQSRLQRCCRMATLLLAVALSSNLALAQKSQRASDLALRDQAEAAKTLAELNQVLNHIAALQERDPSEQLAKYLTKLKAWVVHRRGEAFVKKAAAANQQGDAKLGRRFDAQAMKDFDTAIKLDPDRSKSYHHRGVCFALTGRFKEALRDFSKTIELRPDYANAWSNRGEVRYEMGEFAKAIADYEQAIRLAPDDAGFVTSRGHAYFQLRRFDLALDDYNRAVKLESENAEYFSNRGEAYRSLGQWEQAARDFRQAIELDNKYGRAFQSAAWLMATCPDERFRDSRLAVLSARKALELDGDQDYVYLDTLAAAFATAGQFDQARETISRAIRLTPSDNVGPLKHRLELYKIGKPYRQKPGRLASRKDGTPIR